MFRRRTDKVYATLQDVQRRITQGTEAGDDHALLRPPGQRVSRVHTQEPLGSSAHSSVAPTYRSQPVPQRQRTQYDPSPGQLILPPGMTPLPAPDPGTVTTVGSQEEHGEIVAGQYPDPNVLDAESASDPAYQRLARSQAPISQRPGVGDRLPQGGVFMSAPLLMVLAILWFASIATAVAVTHAVQRGSQPPVDVSGVTSRVDTRQRQTGDSQDVQERDVVQRVRRQHGDHYIVLQSVPRYSAEAEGDFRQRQERHNEQVVADGRLPPWFGVRRPASGGLQYVFGEAEEGIIGIERNDQTERYLELLKRSFPEADFRSLP